MYMNMRRVHICERYFYHYYINPESTILKKDELYHVDHLSVQQKLWSEWEKRGYLQEYRLELEYEFLYLGYLGFLKILALRYTQPPYELFRLQQELLCEKIPDIKNNPYLNSDGVPELHRLLFELLYRTVTRKEFGQIVEYIRQIGL